uniref:Uncharacterized protein n=1 Tax=Psilocybe cubensis TaxID=181762 RepID=A0A8H7XQ15_PSICU
MSINPANEDIESGPEFERIKQNFRNNSIPDAPSNFTEHQILFQNLQLELHTFLGEHMNKVKDLQDVLNEQKAYPSENNRHAAEKGERGSMSLHPPDEDLSSLNRRKSTKSTDAVSQRTLSNHGVKSTRNTAYVSGHDNINRALLDTYTHALLSFLQAHANNIRTLQTSLQNQVPVKAPSTSASAPLLNSKPPPLSAEEVKFYENVNQQFSMLVVIVRDVLLQPLRCN